ncbi:MAG: hypothetical protein IGR76_05605 [Synechococcales cyanobacterium T60_A2020_003]|nr:hypothetical protein [Synechococcales cyanobacterium T60_A2020_003]
MNQHNFKCFEKRSPSDRFLFGSPQSNERTPASHNTCDGYREKGRS